VPARVSGRRVAAVQFVARV